MSLRESRPPFPQTARAGAFTPPVFTPRTVLLVDDDTEVRHVFGLFLRQAGHIVIEACDGAELADWFRGALPKTRIVIISGTAEAKAAAEERGLPILEKPVSLWVFARLVEELARAKPS